MRPFLFCLWILSLHTDAQQHPEREEGAVQPVWRRQGTAVWQAAPPRTDVHKAPARRTGQKLPGAQAGVRRRAALSGPHVCGHRCCVGWTWSPKTRRCTKPRCFPRCRNGALCRRSNRCVCQQGFYGSRCEFSAVTSIHPTISPHWCPVHNTPEPTVKPQRIPEPAKSSVMVARSGPATILQQLVSTRKNTKSRTADLNPSLNVYQQFPIQGENQVSLKTEEVTIKAGETLIEAGSEPEFHNLQSWIGSSEQRAEVIEKTPMSDSQSLEDTLHTHSEKKPGFFKILHVESNPQSGTEEGVASEPETKETLGKTTNLEFVSWTKPERKVTPGLNQSSMTEATSIKLTTSKMSNLESNARPKGEEGENLKSKFNSLSKHDAERLGALKTPELESNPDLRGEESLDVGESRRKEEKKTMFEGKEDLRAGRKKLSLSLREAQAVLLRTALSRGGHGDKLASLLMKHIEKERKKLCTLASSLNTSSSSSVKTSMRTFHTQRGQYTVHVTAATADGQIATGGGGGGGLERIQVMFTPTICKVRCSQDRCVNFCERGNVTTLYSSNSEGGGGGRRDGSHGPGFRVFLCPLLCKNGGICLQKDRCLCPPNFTGKFCQIPIASTATSAPETAAALPSSTNEIVKPALLSAVAANQELTQSEFLLPLGQNQEAARSGAPGPSMVKVRVQHPPEASVKIHQVMKVSGFSPTLRTLSSSSSGSAGAPAPASRDIQAQTVRGGGTYMQQSGFKYCFREVKDGQCSSPLPGLRSRDMCCRGIGKGWGITDCVLCADNAGPSNSSCPAGFEQANGTQCVDVNECLLPGLCENGICVNTRGSYSCVCRVGFILDATHGICISQSVISEEKGQCYRVLGSGQGPSSCSLPILRNITKQICCCSRVGKAWGPDCQRCPYFGSVGFKEICPAGPGYHYSASALQFNQRVTEQLGGRGALQVTQDNQGPVSGSSSSGVSRSQQKPSSGAAAGGASASSSSASGVGSSAGSVGTGSTHRRPSQPQSRPASGSPASRPVQPGSAGTTNTQDIPQTPGRPGAQQSQPESAPSLATQPRPQPPSTSSQGGRPSSMSQPDQPPARGDSFPAPAQPQNPERGSRPSGELPQNRPAINPTTRPTRVQTVRGVCESKPGVCGRGRCLDQPGGKHTCVCDQGYRPNSQRTFCQDVNECVQSPGVCSVGECVNLMGSYRCVCPPGYRSSIQQTSCQDIDECQLNMCINGRCENTPGSYRCVCRLGYKLTGNTCTDVDECKDPLQCPGQECINSPGSYRCVSCQPGYALLNRLCTDIDECRQAPCANGHCENTPGSYRCVCRNGYKLQNNTCADVDECAEPSQCPGQMCVNSVGSYRCLSCRPGYTLTNRQCKDVNECEDKKSCPGQKCVNTEGSYHCVDCQQGYHSVNGECTDVDECVQVSQCPGQQCVNTVGSYRCVSCQPGYSSKDGSCQDVDECASVGVCDAQRVCVNTVGSFRCDCRPGYRTSGLGRQCRDINECLEGDFCFSGGECVNTAGSYTCVCSQGFTLSDNQTSCLDVDECVKSGVCLDGRCVNTEGSFHCQCQTGFTTNPEKTACLDVDECVSSGGAVCGSQRCENTIGSFRCLTSCEPGYQVTQSGECVDVNECANKTVCGDHAVCHNVMGTYQCVCDQGFTSISDRKACVAKTPTDSSSSSSSSSSSPSFHVSVVELDPVLSPLPAARPGELRECYYNRAEWGSHSLLAANTSQQECCCTVGEGWGLGFHYDACPPADSAEFLSLCPSGRGYVTTGPGAFTYRDVDECKRFHPEVCKNGVCVNNIPGYSCYCSSGYVYNSMLLECVDHNECEEESCVGGVCVNTVGSYRCSCQPPLVLDSTQRNCVNSSDLNVDENLSVCWQHLSADMMCQSPLQGAQVTYVDCCCLYGVGWGMGCAICPPVDFEDYYYLCSSVRAPLFPESLPDPSGPEAGAGRRVGASPHFPPYSPDSFPPAVAPDYDDYSAAGGGRSSFRGRTPATYGLPDRTYRRPEYSTGYYSEGDYRPPDGSLPRPPSLRLPPDPWAERAFGARPPPPSQPDGPPLRLAPLPGAPYEEEEEEEEEPWRPGPPFPPFSERGGGTPRRVYERRYESYTGLSTAEDCGILHGCENGRCIRVAEGYTCDCYQGYELDMTSMTCIDKNECEDSVSVEFPCVNARCVNTEGSFRCVCRRGYVMSRRPNHCVAA